VTGRRRLSAATALAAISVVLGVLGAVASVTGWPSWDEAGMLVRALLALAGQACFAATATLLLRELQPTARRSPWVFAGTLIAALTALQLFLAAYSASFDAADAGVPAGPLARLALPSLAVALIGFGAAVAALTVTMRRSAGAPREWVAATAGVLGAAPAAFLFLFPMQWVWFPVAVLVALGVRSVRMSPRRPAMPAPDPSAAGGAAKRARLFAGAALAIVVISWGAGAWVGVATAGSDTATTAMGLAAAAAQLAAIPLFLCVAMMLRGAGRGGASSTPVALATTAGGLAIGALIAFFGSTTDGSAFFLGSAVSGASVGLWSTSLVVPAFRGPLVRVLAGIGLVAASQAAWFMLIAGMGGVLLGVLALVLLIVARPTQTLSPARAAASP
jgi:hypothetical protein